MYNELQFQSSTLRGNHLSFEPMIYNNYMYITYCDMSFTKKFCHKIRIVVNKLERF